MISTILYENNWLLAVNKPAGLLVEKSPYYPSVEAWVENYVLAQTKKPFVGIVHRLDRPVSGVLLLAKRKAALQDLNEQFRLRTVEKIYLALVEKQPPFESGELIHWLKKDLQHKKALIFQKPMAGADECRLGFIFKGKVDAGFLLEIQLHTGKFHQIRAQLSAIGCPIVGDAKYGATTPFLPDAIALHASALRFRDPLSGEAMTIHAPAPFLP